jgi:hypothetical protein
VLVVGRVSIVHAVVLMSSRCAAYASGEKWVARQGKGMVIEQERTKRSA